MTTAQLPDPVTDTPWKLTADERKTVTCAESMDDAMACRRTLYMGFFFDGTRNNLKYDKPHDTHSNVARLYDAFESERRLGEGRQYRYATYVPGVGTEFRKELGDTGVGLHAQAGAAAGWGGEARINWALLQLQNNLHSYAFNIGLSKEDEDRALVEKMSTDLRLDAMQALRTSSEALPPGGEQDRAMRAEVSLVESLQAIASTQWRAPDTDACRTVLAQRRAVLMQKLTPLLTQRLPQIASIRLSVFGFSRGAAAARVFVHWLRDLCDNDSGPMRICGVPAFIDFLGIFDTVASVGASQGLLEEVATGHGGWAQPRHLRIPGTTIVSRCLHLVAGHEVRGSFPLEAASGANVQEVVYPGVHSDVGGGYLPGEQGRGAGDAKLSQIPLCHMYRAAIAAGVPLMDLVGAPSQLQAAFAVQPALAQRLNAYLHVLRSGRGLDGASTEDLVRHHYRQYLHWRRYRLGQQHSLPQVQASGRQDRADLFLADQELQQEWKWLQRAQPVVGVRQAWGSHGYVGMLVELGLFTVDWSSDAVAFFLGQTVGPVARQMFDDLPGGIIASMSPQMTGWQGMALLQGLKLAAQSKWNQWKQVERAWNTPGPPNEAIAQLLEQDVHDSRAWFKPLGKDEDVWQAHSRQRLHTLLEKERQGRARALTSGEQEELAQFRQRLQGRPLERGWIPDDALPVQRGGREMHALWGYLRWRTVYQDHLMDYSAQYPELAQADRGVLRTRKRSLEGEIRQLDAQWKDAYQEMTRHVRPGRGSLALPVSLPHSVASPLSSIQESQQRAHAQLRAVNAFLDELGPAPWWSL